MRHFLRRHARNLFVLFGVAVACCIGASLSLANPAVYEIGDDPGVGFNLISWWSGTTAANWQSVVQSMYDAGFREVSISPVRFTNIHTGDIVLGPSPVATDQRDRSRRRAGQIARHAGDAQSVLGKLRSQRNSRRAVLRRRNRGHGGVAFDRLCLAWLLQPKSGRGSDNFWTDYQNYLVAMANRRSSRRRSHDRRHRVQRDRPGPQQQRPLEHGHQCGRLPFPRPARLRGELGPLQQHQRSRRDLGTSGDRFHRHRFLFHQLLTGSTGYLRANNPSLTNTQATTLANQLADTNTGLNPRRHVRRLDDRRLEPQARYADSAVCRGAQGRRGHADRVHRGRHTCRTIARRSIRKTAAARRSTPPSRSQLSTA